MSTAAKSRLDGTEIRSFNRDGYRRSFGMVLQDTWIKRGTVFDNISYGKPDASMDEVIEAAKKAPHSFVYNDACRTATTLFWQKTAETFRRGRGSFCALPEYLLVHPGLLILDEATSSIDTRTELKIQDAFAAATKGKTSFIVAHRLSTIREADIILVMKDGNVIELGNHETLMAKHGFYYNLYSVQFRK